MPLVLSKKEIKRVLAMAPSLKARVMLSLAYGCGMRAGEVVRLKVGDIDSAQQIIRIVQAKGCKDRNVMLPTDLLDLLRDWWKERPPVRIKMCQRPNVSSFSVTAANIFRRGKYRGCLKRPREKPGSPNQLRCTHFAILSRHIC